MPIYEFACDACGSKETVFKRSVVSAVDAPVCSKCAAGVSQMRRLWTKVAQHKTLSDQVADAEAKYGKELDAAMGPEPDVGRFARRYEKLSKDLPPSDKAPM